MDGMAQAPGSLRLIGSQRTLKAAIGCVGIGLHSGAKVRLSLLPAAPDTGIVFRRTDLPGQPEIAARWDNVLDTRLCTVLGDSRDAAIRVGTVEHVMAALFAAGITNAIVAVNGPEVPILDGSAANFLFLIDCAGTLLQDAPASAIEVVRPVRVAHGAAWIELLPWHAGRSDALDMQMSIDFAAPAIGRQTLHLSIAEDTLRRELAKARTFTLLDEIERLRAAGLARGGSLENAIVVDGSRVLNPGGLRMPDEFVRHKMLDAAGDLALAGAPIRGRFVGHCSGHTLNAELLRAFLGEAANWREVPLLDRLLPETYGPAVRRLDQDVRAA